MYGILGEDPSDANTLKAIVRRLAGNDRLPIRIKGYSGGSEMLRKGAAQLKLFAALDCSRFIVCHDADGPDPTESYGKVTGRIVGPSGVQPCCIVIPVQELEAWLLADIEAVTHLITSWRPKPIPNPEAIDSPKEHLEKLSRKSNQRPRYVHAIHNERLALHIDLMKVAKKCPSFKTLADFVRLN